jgi:hypothetical protein
MIKTKKFLKISKPSEKKEKLLKPVNTDSQGYRDELSEYHALLETKGKPPVKLTKHENVFG